MLNDRVQPIGDVEPAGTALKCASPESATVVPLIPLRNFEGQHVRNLTYEEARDFMRQGLATLKRNRSGKTRYLELIYKPDEIDRHLERVMGGSIITDASRTVRKQHLEDTHWTYQHIRQDLDTKAAVEAEERAADGIIAGPKEPK